MKTTRKLYYQLPKEWILTDRDTSARSMLKHCEELETQWIKDDVKPRFNLWKESEEKWDFISVQRPGSHLRDAAFPNEERIYMTATGPNGMTVYHLVPLVEVE
ncbi:hypothetical protein RRF57_008523 [Xylaria bambusicola]|uniref:Uncharacterized protein n=1 Tax=Xylaria bambusicola TaxID=326684 RepID=A0AAN7V1U0_9PEZI